VTSDPAWIVSFDHGFVGFNTQDGLDTLHLVGVDSQGVHSQLIV
jgi:hypothetical protein